MKIRCIVVFVVLLIFCFSQSSLSAHKQYNSYSGLVMAGYQGWFNTSGDGSGRGWRHLTGKDGFKPGSCNIDLWPDVSEYQTTYDTRFKFDDGSDARVFSSNDKSTVETHFKWMKEYGIDGVFMQRFVGEIREKSGLAHFNKVLSSAFSAANQYDRAICIMYDLSGMHAGDARIILNDIDDLSNVYNLKSRDETPTYLFQNGKPLVCIWGIGFNDGRNYGLDDARVIIDGLIKRGFSIMIGVPTHWRELNSDTEPDPELHKVIKKCDILMPWFVGRYDEDSYHEFSTLIKKDLIWCTENKIEYAPLVFPGFSWKNMKGYNTKQIARNKGSFFWRQISGALTAGCKMLYVAMFDEMDEGTAIFKAATEVPTGESKFIQIDKKQGSDYYLWLTGKAGEMLRGEISLSSQLPTRN